MATWPQRVVKQVVDTCYGKPVWVAYSGGVDSHVLLHLLASNGQFSAGQLHAIHIDHGLSDQSDQWAAHCQQVSAALSVDYHCVVVKIEGIAEHGLESAARQARYSAIADHVSEQDCVLTAQHQDDQAETLLLQLLRGAGPKGLAAMPVESELGTARLLRPLLGVTQAEIVAYAVQHQLQWVEDPSNQDRHINRNYLRHQLWPVLTERWPQAAEVLSRSAMLCAEHDALVTEFGLLDIETVCVEAETQQLSISALSNLSKQRQRNVIRVALQQWQMALPSQKVLNTLLDQVCLADHDKMPIVSWADVEVRRFQDSLYFGQPLTEWHSDVSYSCYEPAPIVLPDGRVLDWFESEQTGISLDQFEQGLTLSFRQGGESILLQGHAHHKRLKHLYQEWVIEPWLRDRVPLLFCGVELIAVVGYGYSEHCALADGETGYLPVLR